MLNPEHPNCTLEVWSGLVFSYRCSKRMDRHGVALSLHAAVSFQCKSGCRPSGPGFLETVDATRCDAGLPPLILPSGLRRTCPSAVRRWAADMQAAEQRHLGASQLLRISFHIFPHCTVGRLTSGSSLLKLENRSSVGSGRASSFHTASCAY